MFRSGVQTAWLLYRLIRINAPCVIPVVVPDHHHRRNLVLLLVVPENQHLVRRIVDILEGNLLFLFDGVPNFVDGFKDVRRVRFDPVRGEGLRGQGFPLLFDRDAGQPSDQLIAFLTPSVYCIQRCSPSLSSRSFVPNSVVIVLFQKGFS